MFTLEDAFREVKVKGKTCIQKGTYKVVLDMSQRFQRIMPHVLDVPNFEGIRIHSGNTDADTEGCILVGGNRGENRISESRVTFNQLMLILNNAISKGETITLEIV